MLQLWLGSLQVPAGCSVLTAPALVVPGGGPRRGCGARTWSGHHPSQRSAPRQTFPTLASSSCWRYPGAEGTFPAWQEAGTRSLPPPDRLPPSPPHALCGPSAVLQPGSGSGRAPRWENGSRTRVPLPSLCLLPAPSVPMPAPSPPPCLLLAVSPFLPQQLFNPFTPESAGKRKQLTSSRGCWSPWVPRGRGALKRGVGKPGAACSSLAVLSVSGFYPARCRKGARQNRGLCARAWLQRGSTSAAGDECWARGV